MRRHKVSIEKAKTLLDQAIDILREEAESVESDEPDVAEDLNSAADAIEEAKNSI